MDTTKGAIRDFVFNKVKEKGKHHHIQMWQEHQDELLLMGMNTNRDLIILFETLKEEKYLYQGSDNEYRIHPDNIHFSGFVNKAKEDDMINKLQVENAALTNDKLKYEQTIRTQDSRIRHLTEQLKYFALIKQYWWLAGVILALLVLVFKLMNQL